MRLRPEEIQVGDVFVENPRSHWQIRSIKDQRATLYRVFGGDFEATISLTQAATYEYIKHSDCLPYPDRS